MVLLILINPSIRKLNLEMIIDLQLSDTVYILHYEYLRIQYVPRVKAINMIQVFSLSLGAPFPVQCIPV